MCRADYAAKRRKLAQHTACAMVLCAYVSHLARVDNDANSVVRRVREIVDKCVRLLVLYQEIGQSTIGRRKYGVGELYGDGVKWRLH